MVDAAPPAPPASGVDRAAELPLSAAGAGSTAGSVSVSGAVSPTPNGTGGRLTFCTAVDAEQTPARGRYLGNERRPLAPKPHGARAVEHHSDLDELGTTMHERLQGKMAEHQREFLLAYKTQMYTVQADILGMTRKAEIQESKLHGDKKIRSLLKQLEWFMTEALKLDEYVKGYKKEADKWKAKAQQKELDRQVIEDQVKGAKRHNKVLKAAAERAKATARHAHQLVNGGSDDEELGSPTLKPAAGMSKSASGPSFNGGGTSAGGSQLGRSLGSAASQLRGQRGPGRPLQGAASAGSLPLPVLSASASAPTLRSAAASGAAPAPNNCGRGGRAEEQYLATIENLKGQIASQQSTNRMIQERRAGSISKKSDLEDLFLMCIDEAKKHSNRTKHLPTAVPKTEKQKVYDAMLTNDTVLVLLYEKVFPHRQDLGKTMVEHESLGNMPLAMDELDMQVQQKHGRAR